MTEEKIFHIVGMIGNVHSQQENEAKRQLYSTLKKLKEKNEME